jgi:hypothetical protein
VEPTGIRGSKMRRNSTPPANSTSTILCEICCELRMMTITISKYAAEAIRDAKMKIFIGEERLEYIDAYTAREKTSAETSSFCTLAAFGMEPKYEQNVL